MEGREGGVVKSIRHVRKGDIVSIYVTDGVIRASVKDVKEEKHDQTG